MIWISLTLGRDNCWKGKFNKLQLIWWELLKDCGPCSCLAACCYEGLLCELTSETCILLVTTSRQLVRFDGERPQPVSSHCPYVMRRLKVRWAVGLVFHDFAPRTRSHSSCICHCLHLPYVNVRLLPTQHLCGRYRIVFSSCICLVLFQTCFGLRSAVVREINHMQLVQWLLSGHLHHTFVKSWILNKYLWVRIAFRSVCG